MGLHNNDDFEEQNEPQKPTNKKHFKTVRNAIQKRKDSINQIKDQNLKMQEYLKKHPEKIEEVSSVNIPAVIKTILIIGAYLLVFGLAVKLSEYYAIMKIISLGMVVLGGIAVIIYSIAQKYISIQKKRVDHK